MARMRTALPATSKRAVPDRRSRSSLSEPVIDIERPFHFERAILSVASDAFVDIEERAGSLPPRDPISSPAIHASDLAGSIAAAFSCCWFQEPAEYVVIVKGTRHSMP